MPEEPWASRVYSPELFATSDGHTNIFTTNNCTIEGRIVLNGEESIVGAPYSSVPGEGFRAKRHHLSQLTIDGLETLMQQSNGFVATMTDSADMLYLIPRGFMFMWASKGCTSIRWGRVQR